ncbi:MAG: mannose-1-phosphate guanylyltransferase [Ignavibacteriae bacterium]|nr:mannose-1-phosphate guanylyltransferase [Ignavibacteriota bacterium]
MKRTAVIMAGGSGERFWPLSRTRKPKQLLNLASDKTMLEDSIERISPLINKEDIFIITSQLLLEPIRKALSDLPPENIIAEPLKRNTAPCLALSAGFIAERYKEEGFTESEISIAVLTADQNIHPNDEFIRTIESALDYVEKNPALATIGIQPDRPETGYGYIEVDSFFDKTHNEPEIKPVVRFLEKPDLDKAKEFLQRGNYLWNSGMFFWRLDTFINTMTKFTPEIGSRIDDIRKGYAKKTHIALPEALDRIAPLFESYPNISIDYALMEKADNVVAAKATFIWDDIGSWDSLDRVKKPDPDGNIIQGTTAVLNTKNSVIINASSKDKIIAGFGLDGFVIVATDDAVLICPKDKVQDVKKCVEKIRNEKGDKYL